MVTGRALGLIKKWLVLSTCCLLHLIPNYGTKTSELDLAPRQSGVQKPTHLTPISEAKLPPLQPHFCLSIQGPSLIPHVSILAHLIHTTTF